MDHSESFYSGQCSWDYDAHCGGDVTSCTVRVFRPGHSQQDAQWIWTSPLLKRGIGGGGGIREEIESGLISRNAFYH
jgi:hypothetical protein